MVLLHSLVLIAKLVSFFDRQKKRMLSFGKKCIKTPSLGQLFPLHAAINQDPLNVRNREMFHVYARPSAYKYSALPEIQRQLTNIIVTHLQ